MPGEKTGADELQRQYECGDIEAAEFRSGLLALLSDQLVWISDLEVEMPMDWDKGDGDVAALWRLVMEFGYLSISWKEVRENAPLCRLFNSVMSQEIREAASVGTPLSLHAALMHSVALVRSNGVAFPEYGAPIELPNSEWLSEEALEWLRRRERAACLKSAVLEAGGHIQLRSSSMDPQYLSEPLRSEVIGYLKANGHWMFRL